MSGLNKQTSINWVHEAHQKPDTSNSPENFKLIKQGATSEEIKDSISFIFAFRSKVKAQVSEEHYDLMKENLTAEDLGQKNRSIISKNIKNKESYPFLGISSTISGKPEIKKPKSSRSMQAFLQNKLNRKDLNNFNNKLAVLPQNKVVSFIKETFEKVWNNESPFED